MSPYVKNQWQVEQLGSIQESSGMAAEFTQKELKLESSNN